MPLLCVNGEQFETVGATSKNIKVGDRVIIRQSNLGGTFTWFVDKVTKITPTECFRTESGKYYSSDGSDKRSTSKAGMAYISSAYLYDERVVTWIKQFSFVKAVAAEMKRVRRMSYEHAKLINDMLELGVEENC